MSSEELGSEIVRKHNISCPDCFKKEIKKIRVNDLEDFCFRVFTKLGVSQADAKITSEILVMGDVRGVFSHGVARLGRYVKGLEDGIIDPKAKFIIEEEYLSTAKINAKNSLGQVVGIKAMKMAIEKAKNTGVGIITVNNSNHYGIAGYYALMAEAENMIGLSTTNTSPLIVPTNSKQTLFGTNPISFSAPVKDKKPFLLDMATSVIPRGKIEVAERNNESMPIGWAVDERGLNTDNPAVVLENLLFRKDGGILPLGGREELFGGHKGYGLAFMVDILSGVLSGAYFGLDVDKDKCLAPGENKKAPNVGHFFMAIDISKFMSVNDFKDRMANLTDMVKNLKPAVDQDEVFYPGEKSAARTDYHKVYGIPIKSNVYKNLIEIAKKCQVEPPTVIE